MELRKALELALDAVKNGDNYLSVDEVREVSNALEQVLAQRGCENIIWVEDPGEAFRVDGSLVALMQEVVYG